MAKQPQQPEYEPYDVKVPNPSLEREQALAWYLGALWGLASGWSANARTMLVAQKEAEKLYGTSIARLPEKES